MMKLLFVLATLALANALDVEITGTECNPDYPVTADLSLDCNGSERCTFGEQANVYGTMYYSGLENSGIENNVAYGTAELKLWTLSYNLFDMMEISLCSDTMTAADGYGGYEYECPGDGSYNFGVTYNLPTAGKESQSWLASGWSGSGIIQLFSASDGTTLVGECTLALSTFVTPTSGASYQTPAASMVFGITAGSLLALVALAIACCCCCKKRQAAVNKKDDKVMDFRRMNDDTSTTPAYVDGGAGRSMA